MATLLDFLQTLNISKLTRQVSSHDARLKALERYVATQAEVIAQINDYTNTLATKLEDLQGRIAAGDAAAVEALLPVAARLRELAADDAEPIPAPLPDEPAPSEPTPVPSEDV